MLESNEEAYILGLWCADGYHRTSSFGLSNIDINLIKRYARYLLSKFSPERLRLRVYIPIRYEGNPPPIIDKICKNVRYLKVTKAKHISYHVYVNSRPLLREFKELKIRVDKIPNEKIIPYMAGRFDGDGSVAADFRKDLRIVYASAEEATQDKNLLNRVRGYDVKIYCYKNANTYCLYVSRYDAKDFLKDIQLFSSRLNFLPRRD